MVFKSRDFLCGHPTFSSHLSGRSATSAASEDSKVVSRFARGPLDQKSEVEKKGEVEVAMTSDITSDHQSTAVTSAMESDSVHSGTDTEIENEDLSEVRAGSAILPNLTIAIERDDDPGIVISFIKLKAQFVHCLGTLFQLKNREYFSHDFNHILNI